MKDSDLSRIRHIAFYCVKISETVVRYGDSLDAFTNDWDFYCSVSMSIMQIGELAGGLSEEFRSETRTEIPWGLVKSMRNMFAHNYASMDKEVVWETASKDVPHLLRFCERTIQSIPPQTDA